jgi:hypothetical protein
VLLRTACEVGVLATAGARRAPVPELTAPGPGWGMPKSRAGKDGFRGAVSGACCPGLLAPRSASGLGPAAGSGRACPDSVQPSW